MRTRKLPNPGTDAAIKQGCTCPVMDNKVLPKNIYMVSTECPVHCPKTKRVFVVNEALGTPNAPIAIKESNKEQFIKLVERTAEVFRSLSK